MGAGDDTTTLSGGGEDERAPDPIGGRCTVPESRSSAIAAAPSSSGISGADTGLSAPFWTGPPPALNQK